LPGHALSSRYKIEYILLSGSTVTFETAEDLAVQVHVALEVVLFTERTAHPVLFTTGALSGLIREVAF
jgi:hypothetical protein